MSTTPVPAAETPPFRTMSPLVEVRVSAEFPVVASEVSTVMAAAVPPRMVSGSVKVADVTLTAPELLRPIVIDEKPSTR